LILRIWFSGFWQNSKGLSPATGSLRSDDSSVTCEGSKIEGKEAAEIKGAVRRRVAADKNFMVAAVVVACAAGQAGMQHAICMFMVRLCLQRTQITVQSEVRRGGGRRRDMLDLHCWGWCHLMTTGT
jgi:hypothetical protein